MAREQDSVWKEVLDTYFREFLAFFFPQIHDDIDWERPYEFLDKELEKIVPNSETGRRLVDKLVKVYLTDGVATWLIIHVEVVEIAVSANVVRAQLFKAGNLEPVSVHRLADTVAR